MLTLNLRSTLQLTDEAFELLCRNNPDLRLERTVNGELVAMSPTGSESGLQNNELSGQVWLWNRQTGLGVTFDSSSGFTLPNGAIRSPDASWIQLERWEQLSKEQRRKFAPVCPDFVLELRSPTDDVELLHTKMWEYLENGARLGWLIDPENRCVEIYRPDQPVEKLETPKTLSGEDVLPSFVLDLSLIWGSQG